MLILLARSCWLFDLMADFEHSSDLQPKHNEVSEALLSVHHIVSDQLPIIVLSHIYRFFLWCWDLHILRTCVLSEIPTYLPKVMYMLLHL